MKKYSKILVLAMFVVAIMSTGVWAGTVTTSGTVSVALEAMGAARNYTIPGAGSSTGYTSFGMKFTPGQTLASGSLLTVSFVNAGFNAVPYYLCEINSANAVKSTGVPVGYGTPSANATNYSFVVNGVGGGNSILLTTSASSSDCGNTGNPGLSVRFQPVTSAGMASVSYIVAISGTTYDSGNAANFANISKQFNTAYLSGNSTIDYANNATANGSNFGGTNAATGGSANIIYTDKDLAAANATAPNAGLSVSAILSLQDTASWQAVQRVYLNSSDASCALANNKAINNAPSGTVALALNSTSFNGAASFLGNVCADVKGNAVIQSRTIKGSYDITVPSGGVDPAADSYTTVMTWMSNSYQGIVPYISADSTYGTICFINNKSTLAAGATADVVSSESGVLLSSQTIGTIGAGTTVRVDFAGTITTYSYSGSTETAGTPVTLTGLQANDRYSAMINVGSAPANITVNCIQKDPAGSKRAVPVLQQNTTTSWSN